MSLDARAAYAQSGISPRILISAIFFSLCSASLACKAKLQKRDAGTTNETAEAVASTMLDCDCAALLPAAQRPQWPKVVKSRAPRPALCHFSGADATSLTVTVKSPATEAIFAAESEAALGNAIRIMEQKELDFGVQTLLERENGAAREHARTSVLAMQDGVAPRLIHAAEVLAKKPESLNQLEKALYLEAISQLAKTACR